MVTANGNVEPELVVCAHKRELIRIALVVEELGEVFLCPFHVSDMDERDSLPEVPRGIGKSLDRIDRI